MIGSFDVETDADGNAVFSTTFMTADIAGQAVTATATDPMGNTSEFAQDIIVASGSGTRLGVPIGDDASSTQIELQTVVAELQNLPAGTTPPTLLLQPSSTDELGWVVAAINALAPPLSQAAPTITITVDLGGGTFQTDTTINAPNGVQVVIQNGTLQGDSPALVVNGGGVALVGLTVLDDTSAPTILVTGGSLVVRDSTIDGSTVADQAAVSITGGAVDLGTSASPGGNTIKIHSGDEFVHNTTENPVPTVGDVFSIDGVAQSAAELSFTGLVSSVNASVLGQKITFTALVRPDNPGDPSPTGAVSFINEATGATLATVNLVAGKAVFSTAALAVGVDDVIASYAGKGRYLTSLDELAQTVNPDPTTTKLSSSANSSASGQSGTFTATVSATAPGNGMPSGTVTFFLDGTTTLGSGTYSLTRTTFTMVVVTRGGFPLDHSSLQVRPQLRGQRRRPAPSVTAYEDGTTTTIVSSVNPSIYGQAATFTATVTTNAPGIGTPTGFVTFSVGSTTLGTALLDGGVATFTTDSPLPIGDNSDQGFVQRRDVDSKTSVATLTQSVGKDSTTTTVATSVNPSVIGQSVTFTAVVAAGAPGNGVPTGTVTFMDATRLGY